MPCAQPSKVVPGAASDWTIPQAWADYTRDEHAIWDRLFARQAQILPGRVAPAFLQGLDILRLSKPGIPDFDELKERLHRVTADSLLVWGSD